MKTLGFCLLILSLSVLHLKAALNYETLADWASSSSCVSENVFQSPVNLLSDKCLAYEAFEMTLPKVTAQTFNFDDATSGAFTLPYNGGTFAVNGRTYATSAIFIRTPAEHHLPNQDHTNSMEVQIELTGSGSNTKNGVLSFIFYSAAASKGYQNALSALNVVSAFSDSADSVTLNLDTLTQKIQEKISNGLFLNIFTYAGTKTYPSCDDVLWYVYGSPLAIDATVLQKAFDALNTPVSSDLIVKSAEGGNNRAIRGLPGSGSGSLSADRLCYTGYFKNYMNYNYGLWFGVVIIVGWFIVNLTLSEKPIKDTEYQENVWTNHPLYSLHHVGNDLFTRKTRMSLLLGTITIHALFSSVWYRRTSEENRNRGSNIIVYAVYSMLVDWVFIFILGSMLRGYYIAKHQYYKTKEEAWQQKSQNRIFAFYFCVFLLACVLWPFCVWNMGELHPEKDDQASNYWVASFFVGLALEMLLVDPIICLLAKSITPLRNLIKHRGYMYDNICHETYLDHLKAD